LMERSALTILSRDGSTSQSPILMREVDTVDAFVVASRESV